MPVWSGGLTSRIAPNIPSRYRHVTLALIKTFHTVVFLSIAGLIVLFAWDGARRRAGRPR